MTRKQTVSSSRSHETATVESLRKDPEFVAEYLNVVLAEGDPKEVLLALRRLAMALGMAKLTKEADLNAMTLYRTRSPKDNPELKSLTALLRALGMQLAVRPLPHRHVA